MVAGADEFIAAYEPAGRRRRALRTPISQKATAETAAFPLVHIRSMTLEFPAHVFDQDGAISPSSAAHP
jgi:hypothetical protein